MATRADRGSRRLRSLSERYGRATLIALAAIVALGFGLRAYRVVDPLASPGVDSHAYYALSKSLYEEGSYGGRTFHDPNDWSPGAPLLYAASFYATGGPREGVARIVEALLGTAAILVVFLLGDRLGGRFAGLAAAFALAVDPPLIHSTGALYSEPPATFTLPAAVLAFLWAEERGRPAAWLLAGVLFGMTALTRPEYLVVGIAFVVLALVRVARRRRPLAGLAVALTLLAAFLVPIVPWTVRNELTLHRLVPISTGGGKALYVGTFMPADGDYQRVKALLVERFRHRRLAPNSEALQRVNPTPLFDRIARRYPNLPRDTALGRIGKENFSRYFSADPLGYLGMTVRKVWRIWSAGVGEAMGSTAGRVVQVLVDLLALAGLALLVRRRRLLEAWAMAIPIAIVTAVGAISLATPRRNEILMTLVFPLAATALVSAATAISSIRHEHSRSGHPSP